MTNDRKSTTFFFFFFFAVSDFYGSKERSFYDFKPKGTRHEPVNDKISNY